MRELGNREGCIKCRTAWILFHIYSNATWDGHFTNVRLCTKQASVSDFHVKKKKVKLFVFVCIYLIVLCSNCK